MDTLRAIRIFAVSLLLTTAGHLASCSSGSSGSPPAGNNNPPGNTTTYGLSSRPVNTTCSIPDAPVTTTGYQLTRVFPALSFSQPVALVQSPVNADRWYVAQQNGVIRTFLTGDSSSTIWFYPDPSETQLRAG